MRTFYKSALAAVAIALAFAVGAVEPKDVAGKQIEWCMIGDSITWAGNGDCFRKELLALIPELAFMGTHTAKFGYSHAGLDVGAVGEQEETAGGFGAIRHTEGVPLEMTAISAVMRGIGQEGIRHVGIRQLNIPNRRAGQSIALGFVCGGEIHVVIGILRGGVEGIQVGLSLLLVYRCLESLRAQYRRAKLIEAVGVTDTDANASCAHDLALGIGDGEVNDLVIIGVLGNRPHIGEINHLNDGILSLIGLVFSL